MSKRPQHRPPARPPAARRVPVGGWIALVVLAIVAAYANSLHGPFVFDDQGSIVDNPTIRSLSPSDGVLTPPDADGQTVGGRPVLNVSFAINYAVGGLAVEGYHATNLAIHVAAALLVFALVRRVLTWGRPAEVVVAASPELIAAGVALLWGVHPLTTSAVTYTVQRAESLAACLALLCLYAFVRGVEARAPAAAWRWHGLGVVVCFLAVATKETAAVVPLVVLLFDRTFVSGSFREAWKRRWRWHLAHAASWVLLAVLIIGADSRGGSAGFAVVTSRWDYLLTQAGAIVRYLGLAAWPVGLTFDYGTSLVAGLREVGAQALLVVALLGTTAWAIVRAPAAGFLGAWFFLFLAPSSSVFPVTSQTVAEHRMYLPLVALVTLAAHGASRLRPRVAFVCGLAAAVALGATTFARNRDYHTAVDLWADTVARHPGNTRAHTNLGTALAQEGRVEEAMASFREALRLYPDHASAHYNLGVALAGLGRSAEAFEHLGAAVRLEPTWADARLNLGNTLVRLGRPGEAVAEYREALRLQPGAVDVELNLGLALLALDRPADAVAPLQRAVAGLSDSVDARFALGNALARSGDFPAAIAAYSEVVRHAPAHVAARANLANALLVAGRTREAIAEYETILRQRPGDAAVRANLEQARAILRAGGAETEVRP
ncbi:MAG: tetratricopeptide repeat protein [Opitutaceae bacterium]|nr:tetratricopeptide repeat protein [Opitutaceae bacterium]